MALYISYEEKQRQWENTSTNRAITGAKAMNKPTFQSSLKKQLLTLYHSYNGADGASLPVDEAQAKITELVDDYLLSEITSMTNANALMAEHSRQYHILTEKGETE